MRKLSVFDVFLGISFTYRYSDYFQYINMLLESYTGLQMQELISDVIIIT